jgi:hypothetical protein
MALTGSVATSGGDSLPGTTRRPTRRFFLGALGGGIALVLAGCGDPPDQQRSGQSQAKSGLVPYTGLTAGAAVAYPAYVTASVEDGYRFALERPDVLRVLPCY